MSILIQTLERSKINKELIGVWKYSDDESFWCGFVIDYNEILVKIKHYTKYGKPDGIVVSQISDIQSIDFNDDYSRAMQVVVDYSKELENESSLNIVLTEDENWNYSVLKQMENNFDIITSVEIGSDYFSGFVVEVSETDFILNCVGKLGEDEGTVIYKIEDVIGFRINDIDNRRRTMLYKWRKASL